jgi:hypothetical protein
VEGAPSIESLKESRRRMGSLQKKAVLRVEVDAKSGVVLAKRSVQVACEYGSLHSLQLIQCSPILVLSVAPAPLRVLLLHLSPKAD